MFTKAVKNTLIGLNIFAVVAFSASYKEVSAAYREEYRPRQVSVATVPDTVFVAPYVEEETETETVENIVPFKYNFQNNFDAIHSASFVVHNQPLVTDANIEEEIICMAQNLYHEARGEGIRGQEMVALVTLNRVKSRRWPNTVCGVVYQDSQFSWTLERPYMNLRGKKERHSFMVALDIARRAISGEIPDNSMGADHYYNPNKVNPYWSDTMRQTVVIGGHRFMKDS